MKPNWRKRLVVIVIVLLAAFLLLIGGYYLTHRNHYVPVEPVFAGSSQNLKSTTVVPTLASRLDPSRNTVWTSGFELAWRELEKTVSTPPIMLDRPSTTSLELAKSTTFPEKSESMRSTTFVMVAQKNTSGTQAVNSESELSALIESLMPGNILAYSSMDVCVPFTIPYFDFKEPLNFGGVPVKSFGIRPEDEYAFYDIRKQPRVLYKKANFVNGKGQVAEEFAIDLCSDSKPCQIVVALVPPGPTLEATLKATEDKINNDRNTKTFDALDVMQVPEIVFDVAHRFSELEGAKIMNPPQNGLMIGVAQEDIRFQLNKSGAYLKASAKVFMVPVPVLYILDRPFLIYVKKRGTAQPFFAMWVGNGALIRKWQ